MDAEALVEISGRIVELHENLVPLRAVTDLEIPESEEALRLAAEFINEKQSKQTPVLI